MPTITHPAKTKQLKNLITAACKNQSLDDINDFIDGLPAGSRFIVRPHKMTPIIVMGWDQGINGLNVAMRCRLVETVHTFPGLGFFFDKEGFLSLLGGTKPHQPWARLPFGHIDNSPAFDIAILEPNTPSHLAEYV